MKSENDKCDIVLIVNVISSLLVGYGWVFECDVVDVTRGVFLDNQVSIVILPNENKLNTIFVTEKQKLVEVGFTKKNSNEPYQIMPLNGFVDSERTSWEIKYAKSVIQ